MANSQKPAPAKKKQGFQGVRNAIWIIVICGIAGVAFFEYVLGNPSNFQGGDNSGHPLPGNLLGTIYKGGMVVPVIITLLFTVIALSVERALALSTANGKGKLGRFVRDIKAAVTAGDFAKAQQLCDKQQGSVANVVRSTLVTYRQVENDATLSKEQKVLAIQKELEEATALEMPMMQENLPIIGTIVTLGTLTGLLGTVMGMIKSFSAMASGEGGADSAALSVGISEALVNTASGIATGAAAVVAYNFYTNKIDRLTFCIDEVGFTVVQTFNATH